MVLVLLIISNRTLDKGRYFLCIHINWAQERYLNSHLSITFSFLILGKPRKAMKDGCYIFYIRKCITCVQGAVQRAWIQLR